jgi:hypothetical protein
MSLAVRELEELSAKINKVVAERYKLTGGGKRKSKGGGLNPALRARLDFAAMIRKDMKISNVALVQRLISIYTDDAKKKNPNVDSVKVVDMAKKAYQEDKKSGGPEKKLKELEKNAPQKKKKSKTSVSRTRGSAKQPRKKESKSKKTKQSKRKSK